MSTTVIIVRADVPQQRGPSLAWGLTYLRTWTGILKMAEMVSIITYKQHLVFSFAENMLEINEYNLVADVIN